MDQKEIHQNQGADDFLAQENQLHASESDQLSEQSAQEDQLVPKSELQACEVARTEWKNKYEHVFADWQNYKRRIEKEQATWIRSAQAEMLNKLLVIVDDFDRALQEHQKRGHTGELDAWLKGFELIGKSLYKFLHDAGVTEIQEVHSFDPTLHEAIAQVKSDTHASGDIVDVLQKGFMFKGQVLRPAKVTVAQ